MTSHLKPFKLVQRSFSTRSMSAPNYVHTSSICIIPPKEVWPAIQEIRAVYDNTFKRWPPHINLIYPFVHNNSIPQHLDSLKECVADVAPFTITLKDFGFFNVGRHHVVWSKPEVNDKSLETVYGNLDKKFKDPKKPTRRAFNAHLTLGQGKDLTVANSMISKFEKEWEEITFEVTEISVITRNGENPFEVRYRVPFGGDVIKENVTIFPQ